jgi:tetratricopeptide (TPR) repeat protein
LGRHASALGSLEVAQIGGLDAPRLDYELGWAAVATGRWARAVKSLEKYLAAKPGQAKATEFLGRAYFGLGQLDKAETNLKRAMELDPRLKETVLYHLTFVYQRQAKRSEAQQTADELIHGSPESRIGSNLKNAIQRAAVSRREKKPWSLYTSGSVGQNTNVIAFNESAPRPADITSVESPFVHTAAGGQYSWSLSPVDQITVGGNADYVHYTNGEISGRETFDLGGFATIKHAFFTELVGTFSVSGRQGAVGGDRALRSVTFRPSVLVQPFPWIAGELYYSYTESDYPNPTQTPTALDRDARTRTVGVTAFMPIPTTPVRVEIGAAAINTSADGTDYDSSAVQVSARLSSPLVFGIHGELFISRTRTDYKNANSLAPNAALTAGFAFKRDDNTQVFALKFRRHIWENIEGFFQYQDVRNGSNISTFDYRQTVAQIGATARF